MAENCVPDPIRKSAAFHVRPSLCCNRNSPLGRPYGKFRMFSGAVMRKLASAIAVIVSIGMPALAADMAVKAPQPAGPVAPVIDWTGFYVGGNLGGVAEHASGTSDFLDTFVIFPFGFATNPQSNSFSSTRLLGGVQAGYNWQFNPQWLVGLEGDWDWGPAPNTASAV